MGNSNKKEIIDMLSKKLGTSAQDIEASAKEGKVENLIGKLSPAQQEKVRNLLSDPNETKKLLENPQVQSLIRKLQGNG